MPSFEDLQRGWDNQCPPDDENLPVSPRRWAEIEKLEHLENGDERDESYY